MSATYHVTGIDNDFDRSYFVDGDVYDLDLPESFDESPGEYLSLLNVADDNVDEQDALLNHLWHLTLSSVSGYQEISELAPCCHLKSFADVIVRQRCAQLKWLYGKADFLNANEQDEFPERLSAFRSIWRCAIWNLEQNNYTAFLEQLEQAEECLEEACLSTAAFLDDACLSAELRDYAVTIFGARAICEDLAGDDPDQLEISGVTVHGPGTDAFSRRITSTSNGAIPH